MECSHIVGRHEHEDWLRDRRSSSEIVVRLLNPITPRWTEEIHFDRILQHLGSMRSPAGYQEDVTRMYDAIAVREGEPHETRNTVGELLVFVLMDRDQGASLKLQVPCHETVSPQQAPYHPGVHDFRFNIRQSAVHRRFDHGPLLRLLDLIRPRVDT